MGSKYRQGEVTGILLWDLSAAFDCLDSNILCDKLIEYGVKDMSVKWFRSFLNARTQTVRIDVDIGCYIQNSTSKTYAARIWNQATENIKTCTSLYTVKKYIKLNVKNLPI